MKARIVLIVSCLAALVLATGEAAAAPAKHGVSMVSSEAGRIDVFTIGADDSLYVRTRRAGEDFSRWTLLGGRLTSAPNAITWRDGRVDVFARGADGAVWQRYRLPDGGWSAWGSLGGHLVSEPQAAVYDDNRIDVFGVMNDNHVWYRTWTADAGWSVWIQLAQMSAAGVTPVWWRGNGNKQLSVFGVTPGNVSLFQGNLGPPFSSWAWWGVDGTPMGSSPHAISIYDDRLDVVMRGRDGAVYQKTLANNQWGGWWSLGGQVKSGPQSLHWHDGATYRYTVAAIGMDDRVYLRQYASTGWEDWWSLGSPDPIAVGSTVKEQNDATIWYIDEDGKRRIDSLDVANAAGFDLSQTVIVPDGSLASMTRDEDITSANVWEFADDIDDGTAFETPHPASVELYTSLAQASSGRDIIIDWDERPRQCNAEWRLGNRFHLMRTKFSKFTYDRHGNRAVQYHVHFQVRSPYAMRTSRSTLRINRWLPTGEYDTPWDDSDDRIGRPNGNWKPWYAHMLRLKVAPGSLITWRGIARWAKHYETTIPATGVKVYSYGYKNVNACFAAAWPR